MKRLYVWFEDDEIEMFNELAEKMTEKRAVAERDSLPPSKQGRRVSRSAVIRDCALYGYRHYMS